MSLTNPNTRRGLRSIIQALIELGVTALLFRLAWRLDAEPAALREIARGVLIILGLSTLLHGAENVTRAISFSLGKDGLKGRIGNPGLDGKDEA